MTRDWFTTAASKGGLASVCVLMVAALLLTGCTRDEVGAAIATFAVQARATLEPWGGTAVASDAATAGSATPAAPDPTLAAAPATAPTVEATLAPSPTPLPPTVVPTPTFMPTATPSPTPPPSPTPLPAEVTVPGGAMRLVAGGFFQMGAPADALLAECQTFISGCQRAWYAASEPVHTVLLAPYYLDATEVTNDAFVQFLNANGGEAGLCDGQRCLDPAESRIGWQDGAAVVSPDRGSAPAAGVTWYGAAAYCAWRGARLPTEAEWEKAAAWEDNTMTPRRYPWGDAFHGQRLNFCDATCDAQQANLAYNDAYAVAAPVGFYPDGRSASGHYDMAGNVWEWVADWFAPDYYATSPGADPIGPATGEQKVVRGGSWFDAAYFTFTTVRQASLPGNADATLGFRCAANVP